MTRLSPNLPVLVLVIVVLAGCTREQLHGEAVMSSANAPIAAGAPASADPTTRGKELFASKTCSACHQMDSRVVGPPLRGVVERRGHDWVRKMIKSPDTMVVEDPAAKALFDEYKTPMPNLNLADEDVDAIVAYLKSEG